MYNSIMVDLETIDTRSTAKLLSVGACAFDINHQPNLSALTEKTFYMNVGAYGEKHEKLFTESEITKQWWANQGDAAKQVLENDKQDPEIVVRAFFSWVKKLGEGVKVWACPPTFDCAILQHHFEVFGLNCPWHWSHERCYRTMRETIKCKNGFIPVEPKAVAGKDKIMVFVKHNALHDAVVQAYKLQQIVQYMRK